MNEKVWLNAIQLTRHGFGPGQNPLFRDLTDLLQRPGEAGGARWCEGGETGGLHP